MRLTVKVYPRSSRRELVEKDGVVKAYINSAPEKGKANKELLELIAEKFGVPKSRVVIVSGAKGRNKIVEVSEK